ncbi:MAG TPA: FtsK/SpoIIIE domain-containing protein [Anaerolineales bacterium]|nr:FtsK/SpoIIIE domain-containing protein [Anaerolineales bacterium]
MTTDRRFSSALQALTELQTNAQPAPAVPALSTVLAKLGAVPAQALFLGIASDGLPVLLNLSDPHPGPMLISGDAGSGKTAFLKTLAQAAIQMHRSDDVQFGVITNYADEWASLEATSHQAGIFSVGHAGTSQFIHSLAGWAHSNKNTDQWILLLVDDLESVASMDPETVQDFRWLLLRGPARRVWPIITLNAPRYGQVLAWLQNFRTRIFGRIANSRVAEALGGDRLSSFDQLEAGTQFSLREKDKWLRLWLPSC